MSNFKNALKLQGLVEENATLKSQIKLNAQFAEIDKKKNDRVKKEFEKLAKEYQFLAEKYQDLVASKLSMEEELIILKSYFRLKL